MSGANAPKRRRGWDIIREENERGFESRFAGLRDSIRRHELFGSVVELFISAVAGVTSINFRDSPEDDHKDSRA